MPLFEQLDGPALAQRIRTARHRELVACPGFGHDVASALVAAHRLAPPEQVSAVADGTNQGARLGYSHADAVAELARANLFREFSAVPSKAQPELPGMR